MAKTTVRDLQRLRHHELIRACIRQSNGQIGFEDVDNLYAGWKAHWKTLPDDGGRKHFRTDCENLVKHFDEMAESYLSPFFLPTPHIEYADERLSITSGLRPIAVNKNYKREFIPGRRALAQFVGTNPWPPGLWPGVDGPLFPEQGRVYAGHGSTVCIFFHELLCESRIALANLTLYTASFEIASLLYYLDTGAKKGGIRFGENLRVDREMGAILPHDTKDIGTIDVAIISCNGISSRTILSTADERTHNFARPYLEKAERIVLIAEEWKIGREDGDAMTIPGLGSKPVLLVTDAEEAKVLKHKPEGLQYLLAPRTPA